MDEIWTSKDNENLHNFIDNLKLNKSDLFRRYEHNLKHRRWCVRNKVKCLAEINKYLIDNYGIDIIKKYGIPKDFRMANLPEGIETRGKDAQLNPMPFDQKFYEKLMSCAKIRVTSTDTRETKSRAVFKDISTSRKKYDTRVLVNWLAGKVDDQIVLFKEVISYPIDGLLYKETVSRPGFPNVAGCYELKAILGVSGQHICELVRSDYNPLSPHRNFMEGDIVSEEPESIYGSHTHIVKDSYNVAFPTLFVHGEAEYMDIENSGKRLTFAQVVFANRKALNVRGKDFGMDFMSQSYKKMYDDVYNVAIEEYLRGTFSDRLVANIDIAKSRYEDYKNISIEKIGKFDGPMYSRRENKMEK